MATNLRLFLALCALCLPPLALAEELPDPTRPAIDLRNVAAGGGLALASAAPRGLQSIIISPQYRAAIINGETVVLGGKSGDSKLVEVRENSVVLQNAQGRRVMELFPKVGIKKNEVVLQNVHEEDASEQAELPEKAVGGVK